MRNEFGSAAPASTARAKPFTDRWFADEFAAAPDPIPMDLHAATTAFCKVYQVSTPGAPLAIANALASALGRIDGAGRFDQSLAPATPSQVRNAAQYLAQTYGPEIAASRARQGVTDVLEMSLRAGFARSRLCSHGAPDARPN